MNVSWKVLLGLLAMGGVLIAGNVGAEENSDEADVVVYSARKEHLIKPLLDAYQQKAGITIEFQTDNAEPLIERLQAEGPDTPADLFIAVDAGNLWQAADKGLLERFETPILRQNVPPAFQDPDHRWYGLTLRARTMVYNTGRVGPNELSTYEDLALPKWKQRLCLRTSKKVYNQSLVAMMIQRMGEQKTEEVVRGWVDNLAQPPFSNDTQVMEAIAAGRCDVGIVNTYYYGELMAKQPTLPLKLFWPNQQTSGVHVNISGAGVTKYAKNPEDAGRLLEWLTTPEAQQMFAAINFEYPINHVVPPHAIPDSWGKFKRDESPLVNAGALQSKAVMLMDRAGYK